MAKVRVTSYIAFAIISICLIYWWQRALQPLSTEGQSFYSSLQRSHGSATDADDEDLENSRDAAPYGYLTDQGKAAQVANDVNADADAYDTKSSTIRTQLEKPDADVAPSFNKSDILPTGYAAAFPREIWQSSSEAGKAKYAKQMQTWLDVKGFTHHWLSDDDMDRFVHEAFNGTKPSLVTFWDDLSSAINAKAKHEDKVETDEDEVPTVVNSTSSSAIVLRAELLRYMLMYARGGVYADIDTSVLLHVDRWIPDRLGSQIINAIIGIEYDDTTYEMFVRPISFCQRALMSKPKHEIFRRAIDRVMSNLEYLARRQRVESLSQLRLDKLDVFEATGPGMISDVVLEVIRDQMPEQEITWSTFHDQKEPVLFGDVLILPINGFAGNQKHSHAGNVEYGEKYVQHHFGRSWYAPQQAEELPPAASPKATTTPEELDKRSH